MSLSRCTSYALGLSGILIFAGCHPSTTSEHPTTRVTQVALHDHDHDGHNHDGHDHDHEGHSHVGHSHAGHAHNHAHGDEREHSDVGPHGGHIIELGRNHRYHAELLEVTEPQLIRVYILDGRLKPIAMLQDAITISLTVEGKTSAFEIQADTSTNEPGLYQSADPALYQLITTSSQVTGKMRVMIEGVPYVGRVAHQAQEHAQR